MILRFRPESNFFLFPAIFSDRKYKPIAEDYTPVRAGTRPRPLSALQYLSPVITMIFGKNREINKLRQMLTDASSQLDASRQLYNEANEQMKKIQAQSAEIKKELGSVSAERDALSQKLDSVSKNLQKVTDERDSALSAIKTSGTEAVKSEIQKDSGKTSGRNVFSIKFKDGESCISDVRVCSGKSFEIPSVPEKEDYAGLWSIKKCGEDLIASPVYVPIGYDTSFYVDGKECFRTRLSAENHCIPPVPAKDDFRGEWVYSVTGDGSVRVDAVYTPVTYKLIFEADGKTVYETETADEEHLVIPEIPAKDGFKGEWMIRAREDNVVYIEAVYTKAVRTVRLCCGGKKISEFTVPAGEPFVIPDVPDREDYTGEWIITEKGMCVRAEAVYKPIEYTLKFISGGKVIKEARATCESGIDVPEVPPKEDYTGEWEYEISGNEVTLYPVYTPSKYRLEFFVDGKKYGEIAGGPGARVDKIPAVPEKDGVPGEWVYTFIDETHIRIDAVYPDTPKIKQKFYAEGKKCFEREVFKGTPAGLPPVPEKEDYKGSWKLSGKTDVCERYCAEYEPIEYTASFYVDGELFAEAAISSETDKSVIPPVPAKRGYTGEWYYSREGPDRIKVTAIYTPE